VRVQLSHVRVELREALRVADAANNHQAHALDLTAHQVSFLPYTPTDSHTTHTRTYTHTLSLSLSVSRSLSLPPSPSLSPSLPHTHI
jgi:hypothetical protein